MKNHVSKVNSLFLRWKSIFALRLLQSRDPHHFINNARMSKDSYKIVTFFVSFWLFLSERFSNCFWEFTVRETNRVKIIQLRNRVWASEKKGIKRVLRRIAVFEAFLEFCQTLSGQWIIFFSKWVLSSKVDLHHFKTLTVQKYPKMLGGVAQNFPCIKKHMYFFEPPKTILCIF